MAIPALRDEVAPRTARLRLVGRSAPAPAKATSPAGPVVPTRQLAQVIAEVLVGARPAAQLSDVAAPEVIRLLARSAGRLSPGPGLRAQRAVVGAVHVHQPAHGVAEACAVIDLGIRCRAIAFRLDAVAGRWQCTALHIG
jgi:hypothetical protein